MKKKEKHTLNNAKERTGKKMTVLTKPINRVSVIPEKDVSNFVREFNKNKVSKEFLKSCKKAGKLFEGRK